jgi:cation:H+ antiporter
MGLDLAIAVGIFLVSAGSVIYFGTQLAKYGDVLATLTGWGRLFVGSILVAMATSLPELSTNISAVRLDPPNPELALGNVLGANMINMLTFAVVALIFGGKSFLQKVAPAQGYLITLAVILTALTVLFAWFKPDISFWNLGLSSAILLVIFVVGMRIVYAKRPQGGDTSDEPAGMTLSRAWVMFSLVSVGVIIAGYFLAFSVDQIAAITGVASSTLGILLASLVTTMPEATATIAAARMGAPDLGIGNLYGSCAFNVTILFFADPFYRQGIVLNQTEPTHFVAGGVAIVLMLVGLVLVLAHHRLHRVAVSVGLAVMAAVYLAGAVAVARLGSPDIGGADATGGSGLIPGGASDHPA